MTIILHGSISQKTTLNGMFFILQVIYKYGEPRWNYIDRGKQSNLEKNPSQCNFVHHKSHMD
jgi:hypothetical protein